MDVTLFIPGALGPTFSIKEFAENGHGNWIKSREQRKSLWNLVKTFDFLKVKINSLLLEFFA